MINKFKPYIVHGMYAISKSKRLCTGIYKLMHGENINVSEIKAIINFYIKYKKLFKF